MKSAVALLVLGYAAVAGAADSCPASAPIGVQTRLEPVLKALAAAREAQREWDPTFELQIGTLLRAKDPISREARIAAMSYYLGESYSTIIVCRVAKDGADVVRALHLYNRCALMPDRSLLPAMHPSVLRERALKIIHERSWKQSCVFE